jgi:hypothetical protein
MNINTNTNTNAHPGRRHGPLDDKLDEAEDVEGDEDVGQQFHHYIPG